MEFRTVPEFDSDLKKLLKKYRSLEDDLELLKKILVLYPRGFPPRIYRVKHFHCKALKNKGAMSGIRIVYAYLKEVSRIEFIEIYFKEKDDTDCSKERIGKYYSN
jgi:mRNA-degrading endonuclease RelE of RelBE toxin-antitoxin system